MVDITLLKQAREMLQKKAAVPMPPMPPPPPIDPATGQPLAMPGMPPPPGGMPPGMPPGMPMDPAMMGGMPPGGMPMDPSMMGGMPPGGMPMDPAMMGGMPPEMAPPPEGTPLTEERLMELLPEILKEVGVGDKSSSKSEMEDRVEVLEDQLMSVMQTIGMVPSPEPGEVGVTSPSAEGMGAQPMEQPVSPEQTVNEGMTPEAVDAAASQAEAPSAPPGMAAEMPPGMPQGMPPGGLPIMASERRLIKASSRIRGLISKLHSAR